MAQAAPLIIAAIGTAATIKGQMDQKKALKSAARRQEAAAEQARGIAAKNAAAIEAETNEMVSREKKAASEAQSLRRARAAASGGTAGGSTGAFLDEQASREKGYIDWLKKSGASRADIEREGGDYAYARGLTEAGMTASRGKQAGWNALSSAAEGGGNIYSLYKQQYP